MAKRVFILTSMLAPTFALTFVLLSATAAGARDGGTVSIASGRKKVFTSLADFSGANIASGRGSVLAGFIDRVIPSVNHYYFDSLAEAVEVLVADRVDAISLDIPVALYLAAQNPAFTVFPYVAAEDSYGFAVAKGSQLGVKGNEVLKKLIDDCILYELEMLWFSADESRKSLPKLRYKRDFNGSAGTIRYGCQTTRAPMSYLSPDGKPLGLDLDLVARIAYELNMKVEFIPMRFDELLPALASGRADMVGGSFSITEERLKKVDFIGPYFEGGTTLVIKKNRLGKK